MPLWIALACLGAVLIAIVISMIVVKGSAGEAPVSSGEAAAEIASCYGGATSVSVAVAAFDARNAPNSIKFETTSGPGSITIGDPSTYGKGTQAQALLNSTFLKSWPQGQLYSISLATATYGQPGDIIVYTANTPTGLDWTTNAKGGNGPSACGAIIHHV
jgi:hypothetical protein